jgi:hypothetical protein
MILPAAGLVLLFRARVSFTGPKAGHVSRLLAAFISSVMFDGLRLLGYDWAVYGLYVSLFISFSAVGLLAATYYYCPEVKTVREAVTKLRRNPSFYGYYAILLSWLALSIASPISIIYTTLLLLATVTVYPTRLFILARRRANITRVREMLTVLAVSWCLLVFSAPILFALGATTLLGPAMPYAYEIAFLTSSLFIFLMAKAVQDPTGLTRAWTGMLVPQTMIKLGQNYLVIHDSGTKAQSFLASAIRNLVNAGTRIIVRASTANPLLQDIFQNDQHFSRWIEEGKIQGYTLEGGSATGAKEGISGRLGLGPASTVYITEMQGSNPLGGEVELQKSEKDPSRTSDLLLVERTRAPRSQVADFLRRNKDVELLDLSEPASPFSSLANQDHSKIQGNTILLEYEASTNYEELTDRYLDEATANAELPVLFTSKSSKLYRAMKGKEKLKLVSASSLVSAPDELPDGEVQIPDKELGLVTSIASDFLENNRDMAISFTFDSLTELIRGDRWEQIYSGIKQLVELLTVPNATSLFLIGRESFEPRFLGAIRALFSVQMAFDAEGLHLVKLGTA